MGETRTALGTLFLLVFLLTTAMIIYNSTVAFPATGQPIRNASNYLIRARASINLTFTVDDINTALRILESYHGNPSWFYPTIGTDFDNIKQFLINARDTALYVAAHSTPNSFEYQQTIHNLADALLTQVDHLSSVIDWMTLKSVGSLTNLVAWVISIIGLIGYGITSDSF